MSRHFHLNHWITRYGTTGHALTGEIRFDGQSEREPYPCHSLLGAGDGTWASRAKWTMAFGIEFSPPGKPHPSVKLRWDFEPDGHRPLTLVGRFAPL